MAMTQLESLHACYCSITGIEIRFCFHERVWWEFVHAGFTVSDLRLVLAWMMRENKRMDRTYKYSMRLSTVINDLSRFDEMRACAAAVERNRRAPMTPKEKVLQQWKPEVGEQPLPGKVIPIMDALKRAVNQL